MTTTLTAKDATLVKDIYNKSGINGLWNWILELELKRPTHNQMSLAIRYVKVGNKEVAMNWLEKCFENRPSVLPRINNIPELEALRSEHRFQTMIKKMGLSDYQRIK